MGLGDFVRSRILELGISESEFARRVKSSQALVNKVCHGSRPVPFDRIEAWANAMQFQDDHSHETFILLCRKTQVIIKQDLESVMADFEGAIEEYKDRLNRALNGDRDMLLSVPVPVPLLDIRKAKPWKRGPRNPIEGLTLGHFPFHPVSSKGKPLDSLYRFELFDADGKRIDRDASICAGAVKVEQKASKLLAANIKAGLPAGWYRMEITLVLAGIRGSSQSWSVQSPSGTIVKSQLDHDDR